MNAIVAVDRNGGIGRNGKLLFRISDDLKRFRSLTEGSIVVMGRKTWDSLPKRNPLPNRTKIVLTRDTSFSNKNCRVIHSIEEFCRDISPLGVDHEMFLIGGGEIYRQLLQWCMKIYMTYVDKDFKADTFFPVLDPSEWLYSPEDDSDFMYDEETGLRYQYKTFYRALG